jgi:hypothetical protein
MSSHSGADFERGHLGHRNGPQIPGTEHEVTDGTQPEDGPRGAPGTGLGQRTAAAGRVRKPSQTLPARMGPVWATANVIGREYETTPKPNVERGLQGLQKVVLGSGFCGAGGLTRVEEHVLNAQSVHLLDVRTEDPEEGRCQVAQKIADAARSASLRRGATRCDVRARVGPWAELTAASLGVLHSHRVVFIRDEGPQAL